MLKGKRAEAGLAHVQKSLVPAGLGRTRVRQKLQGFLPNHFERRIGGTLAYIGSLAAKQIALGTHSPL